MAHVVVVAVVVVVVAAAAAVVFFFRGCSVLFNPVCALMLFKAPIW